jgi:hypothetical protein
MHAKNFYQEVLLPNLAREKWWTRFMNLLELYQNLILERNKKLFLDDFQTKHTMLTLLCACVLSLAVSRSDRHQVACMHS